MNRRDFLTGMATAFTTMYLVPRKAFAFGQTREKLFVTIEAIGGWDTSILMDPKSGSPFTRSFEESDIEQVGNIRFAPRVGYGSNIFYQCGPDDDRQSFFHKYAHRLTVVHGVDTETNSHDVGPRHVFSGNRRDGSPTFSALAAAAGEQATGEALPFGFIGTGGYIETSGIISTARAGGTRPLRDLIYFNDRNTDGQGQPDPFLDAQSLEIIRAAEAEQLERRRGEPLLPRMRRSLEKIAAGRAVERALTPVADELNRLPDLSSIESNNQAIRSAQTVMAALSSGACASAHISINGFDTHGGSHDNDHPQRAEDLLGLVDYVWRMAEFMGFADRLTVIVGSDFSRTTYNDGGGKDHWPITSMMLMGNGIAGGRVMGKTADNQFDVDGNELDGAYAHPVRVEGSDVQIADLDDPEAELIKPGHIHQALRRFAGITDGDIGRRFPLNDERQKILPIFE